MSQVVLSPIVPRALTSLWVIHRLCDQPYVGLDPAVGHAWCWWREFQEELSKVSCT